MSSKKSKYLFVAMFFVAFAGCESKKQNNTDDKSENREQSGISIQVKSFSTKQLIDTVVLTETHNEKDIIVNEYLIKKLKPIRDNFERINSISTWTSTNSKDLSETTEGGEATFYYRNGVLEKIVTKNFGETIQQLSEYYLLSRQLSFVFEKSYKYNRPMYYDSAAMKENDDTEAFDFQKSEVIEDRSYFENGALIHQINNQDCGSPSSSEYLIKEERRIKTLFSSLMKLGGK